MEVIKLNRLTSDYGVIIKWSDYFIECYEYNSDKLTFIDSDGNWLEQDYIFLTEKEIKCYLDSIKPYCDIYKIIKVLKHDPKQK